MNMKPVLDYIVATNAPLTPLKLQQLAYYVKVWSLVAERPLLPISFQKSPRGPFSSDIDVVYQTNGIQQLPLPTDSFPLTEREQQIIDLVLATYGDKSSFALNAMLQREAPWTLTADNAVIDDAAILAYYSQKPFAKNFQNGGHGTFYLLQDDNWHAFTLDMSPDDAAALALVSSYEAYQSWKAKARRDVGPLLDEILPAGR